MEVRVVVDRDDEFDCVFKIYCFELFYFNWKKVFKKFLGGRSEM